MNLIPISQREIPGEEDKIGQNQGYLPGETGRRPSKKKREKKLGVCPGRQKSGETGKRHGFLKVVTVNGPGDTGRQFEVKSSEFFSGETGKRHRFLKVVTVNRSGETGRQFEVKFSEFFFSGETGKRLGILKVVTVNRSGETGRRVWLKKFRNL